MFHVGGQGQGSSSSTLQVDYGLWWNMFRSFGKMVMPNTVKELCSAARESGGETQGLECGSTCVNVGCLESEN